MCQMKFALSLERGKMKKNGTLSRFPKIKFFETALYNLGKSMQEREFLLILESFTEYYLMFPRSFYFQSTLMD